jgi:hypothetical protein
VSAAGAHADGCDAETGVRYVKGWFNESLPGPVAAPIAMLRVDSDIYVSIYDTLDALYPRLAPWSATALLRTQHHADRTRDHANRTQKGHRVYTHTRAESNAARPTCCGRTSLRSSAGVGSFSMIGR